MRMEHDERYGHAAPFVPHHGHWPPDMPGYHPHHHSPPSSSEYGAAVYNYMDNVYSGGHSGQRASHQQLQPLVVPQWPSLLASQPPSYSSSYPQASPPQPSQTSQAPAASQSSSHPASAPPAPRRRASAAKGHIPNPRKTLSEADRRRMCLFHEENPLKKQTEIGAMFGVERSTVSKVLRQKERYLESTDGSRSPIKKSRGKFPDIERALTNWIRNWEKKNDRLELTDELIRNQAKFFSSATHGGAEANANIENPKWLSDFKRRNNVGGSRSRKGSIRASHSSPPVSPPSHHSVLSPISMSSLTTPSVADPSAGGGSPRAMQQHMPNTYTVYHSQSNSSLSSEFGTRGTPPTTYSTGQTPAGSPSFAHESLSGDGQYGAALFSGMQTAPSPMQRARSQTFPVVSAAGSGGYISPPASSKTGTPNFVPGALNVGSPLSSEMPPPSSIPSRQEYYQQQDQYQHQPQSQPQPQHQHQNQHQHQRQQIAADPEQREDNGSMSYHNQRSQTQPQTQPNEQTRPITSIRSPPTNYTSQTFSPARSASSSLPASSFSPPYSNPRPSRDEARAALETVLQFLQNQPQGPGNAGGVTVESQDFVMIGQLVEKLKVQQTPRQTPPSSSSMVPTQTRELAAESR